MRAMKNGSILITILCFSTSIWAQQKSNVKQINATTRTETYKSWQFDLDSSRYTIVVLP
jgi:hypothetical protein